MQSKQFDIYFSGPTTVNNDESNVRTRIQILQMPLCKQTLIHERERDRDRERERERKIFLRKFYHAKWKRQEELSSPF